MRPVAHDRERLAVQLDQPQQGVDAAEDQDRAVEEGDEGHRVVSFRFLGDAVIIPHVTPLVNRQRQNPYFLGGLDTYPKRGIM